MIHALNGEKRETKVIRLKYCTMTWASSRQHMPSSSITFYIHHFLLHYVLQDQKTRMESLSVADRRIQSLLVGSLKSYRSSSLCETLSLSSFSSPKGGTTRNCLKWVRATPLESSPKTIVFEIFFLLAFFSVARRHRCDELRVHHFVTNKTVVNGSSKCRAVSGSGMPEMVAIEKERKRFTEHKKYWVSAWSRAPGAVNAWMANSVFCMADRVVHASGLIRAIHRHRNLFRNFVVSPEYRMISVITTCMLETKLRTAPTANAVQGIVLLSFEYLRNAKRFINFGEMANHTISTHPHCRMATHIHSLCRICRTVRVALIRHLRLVGSRRVCAEIFSCIHYLASHNRQQRIIE